MKKSEQNKPLKYLTGDKVTLKNDADWIEKYLELKKEEDKQQKAKQQNAGNGLIKLNEADEDSWAVRAVQLNEDNPTETNNDLYQQLNDIIYRNTNNSYLNEERE